MKTQNSNLLLKKQKVEVSFYFSICYQGESNEKPGINLSFQVKSDDGNHLKAFFNVLEIVKSF